MCPRSHSSTFRTVFYRCVSLTPILTHCTMLYYSTTTHTNNPLMLLMRTLPFTLQVLTWTCPNVCFLISRRTLPTHLLTHPLTPTTLRPILHSSGPHLDLPECVLSDLKTYQGLLSPGSLEGQGYTGMNNVSALTHLNVSTQVETHNSYLMYS